MPSEVCEMLTDLKLNEDKKQILRDEIEEWVKKKFLPKLERETVRTQKCRLVASVERHTFDDDNYAARWKHFKSEEKSEIEIVDGQKKEIGEKMNTTCFQKKILRQNSDLGKIFIGKNEIEDETEGWKLNKNLENIHIGGEAAVFNEKFGNLEIVVRVHAFDSYVFTKELVAGELKTKTHLFSGKLCFIIVNSFSV